MSASAEGVGSRGDAKTNATPLRTAVVGVGYWGPNLVRVLNELPEAELVSVCDLRPSVLDPLQRRYPALRTTCRFEDLLEDPTVEAIVVATPVSSHYDLARRALAAGKHVFVEKPLAASVSEAIDLIELARRHELVLMPGHVFLYSPPVVLIRELIASGELGDIYFISMSRVNLGLHQSDVSVVWDLAPHDFSILMYWLDEGPTETLAISRSCVLPDVADVAFVNLVFPTGTLAHVELSWLAPSKLRRTTIVGSKKMVVYDDTSNEPVRVFDSGVMPRDPQTFGEFQLSYRAGDIISPRVEVSEPLALELADFCSSVRHGTPLRSSPELGLEVVRMVEDVDRSLALNGKTVALAPLRSELRAGVDFPRS